MLETNLEYLHIYESSSKIGSYTVITTGMLSVHLRDITARTCKHRQIDFCSGPKPKVNSLEEAAVKVHKFPGKIRDTEVISTTRKVQMSMVQCHLFDNK